MKSSASQDTLTHFDGDGNARMVDVGAKPDTEREALAVGVIRLSGQTLARIREGSVKKGDVLAVARIAGLMAAKRTAELVPLCHPLALTRADVEFDLHAEPPSVSCRARVATRGPTGVEIEALTAVQIALLTIYDMCKSMDRGMVIDGVRLLEKRGGASGTWLAPE